MGGATSSSSSSSSSSSGRVSFSSSSNSSSTTVTTSPRGSVGGVRGGGASAPPNLSLSPQQTSSDPSHSSFPPPSSPSSFSSFSPFPQTPTSSSTSTSSFLHTTPEQHQVDTHRKARRAKCVKYAHDHFFYGVPVKLRGVLHPSSTRHFTLDSAVASSSISSNSAGGGGGSGVRTSITSAAASWVGGLLPPVSPSRRFSSPSGGSFASSSSPSSSPTSFSEGGLPTDDPDQTWLTVDVAKLNRQLSEGFEKSGVGGGVAGVNSGVSPDGHVGGISPGVGLVVDLDRDYASYPEAVCVDRDGDITVIPRGGNKTIADRQRRVIKAEAVCRLKDVPPEPEKPYVAAVEREKITVGWEPSDEGTGLIDKYHLEFKEVRLGTGTDEPFKTLAVLDWRPPSDLLHVAEPLRPNTPYVFRLKVRNTLGWSTFSEASEPATTEASHPDRPAPPFVGVATVQILNVHWRAPNDNGSRITSYQLRGKKVGGTFRDEYSGPSLCYAVADLEKGSDYVFEVRATNGCGRSEWSRGVVVTAPKEATQKQGGGGAWIKLGGDMGHLWIELWDGRDERNFYFHTITGERRLEPPTEWLEHVEKERLKRGNKAAEDAAAEELDPVKAFRLKRFKFFKALRATSGGSATGGGNHAGKDALLFDVKIRRSSVFSDTLAIFSRAQRRDLMRRTKVAFAGEEGIDSGGLTKDWYLALSRTMSVDQHRIFKDCGGGHLEIHTKSNASPTSLQKFNFAGAILGKALYDRVFIDMPFSKAMYKLILGADVGLEDVAEVDPPLFKSLKWIQDNCVEGIIFQTFSVEVEVEGEGTETTKAGTARKKKVETIALCENGESKDVTEENKLEYVKLMAEWRVKFSVVPQLEAFMAGLNMLVPTDLLRQFTLPELEMLFNGKKNIDVDEIRAYTIYQGKYDDTSKEVVWFWQFVRELEMPARMTLLKFVTGSDRLPLDGFDPPFNITEGSDMTPDDLPRSHTCFNQIVLPKYNCYLTLKNKVTYAMVNCEGFALT